MVGSGEVENVRNRPCRAVRDNTAERRRPPLSAESPAGAVVARKSDERKEAGAVGEVTEVAGVLERLEPGARHRELYEARLTGRDHRIARTRQDQRWSETRQVAPIEHGDGFSAPVVYLAEPPRCRARMRRRRLEVVLRAPRQLERLAAAL